ncbi:MAG TPA: hypothetical protein VLH81_01540, partial [Desulfobacterales bacterium]|nr:hypothetical protein [Desulfobacterales bacterium]
GATDLLAGTATGRVDLPATTGQVGFGNTAEFNAATKVSMMWELEMDAATTDQRLFLSDSVGISVSSLALTLHTTGGVTYVYAYFDGGANYQRNTLPFTVVAGTRFLLGAKIDLTLAGAARLVVYSSLYDSGTRRYGTWTAASGGVEGGTIPASISAEAGNHILGSGTFDGKADDFRWKVGEAYDFTAIAPKVNEADPSKWAHWWPFDGDGVDIIGGLTATVTGGSYVDDGRHHLGRFERYTKQGQYAPTGSTAKIAHGDYAALRGASQFALEYIYTPAWKGSEHGLMEYGLMGTDGCLVVAHNSTDALLVYTPTAAADTGTRWSLAGFFTEGVPTRIRVEYDGTQSTNATRLRIWKSTYDAATGTWSTLTEVTASGTFAGTIPATLQSPTTNRVLVALNRQAGTSWARGLHDRFAIHAGGLPAGKTPYESGAASYDIWCDYNGNANNAGLGGATYNGTVTGAIQWYDGRQPEGWTNTSLAEIDRATGANQSSEGTYGLRLKGDAAGDELRVATPSMTLGRWVVVLGSARKTAGSPVLRLSDGGSNATAEAATALQGTMAATGAAGRLLATGTGLVRLRTGTGAEAYFDNLRALQLAVVSLSVSTSGVPSRVIWSASKNGVTLPYVYAALATDEKLEIGVRNVAGTRTEASSSGSVTTGVHSLILEFNGTDTLKAYLDAVEVASVAVSGSFTGLDRLNLGGLPGFVGGHPFDERIAEPVLWDGADFAAYGGLKAIDRIRLHNWLAARVTGLVAV